MRHNYSINYKNITLRPLEKCDIEQLRIWRNNIDNSKYLTPISQITKREQLIWFNTYLERNTEIIFAIEEKSHFNKIVGSLSLYDIDEDVCLFGKILIGDSQTRGYGIGTHATEAALKVAIEQLGVSRVLLFVYADNIVAFSVYKNIGFEIIDEHKAEDGRIEYTMEFRK